MDRTRGAIGPNRRHFVRALAVAALALLASCARPAQQARPARVYRVGYLHLHGLAPGETDPLLEVFQQGLRDLGYVEGENVVLEARTAQHQPERYPELVAELLAIPVDVIVVGDSQAIPIAKRATSTVPIVMAISGDVVGQGLVASLARPGGNVTGLTNLSRELSGKRLEYLREVVRGGSRFAVLWNADNPSANLQWRETQAAAAVLGVQLQSLEVRRPPDIPSAFEAAVAERAEGLVVPSDPLTSSQRSRIVQLAAEHRLPAMYGVPEFVEIGGLMAYGADRNALHRRAAAFVDKILKGANPATLPVEQPTRFELAINLQAAQALGLAIPYQVLLDATAVIQ